MEGEVGVARSVFFPERIREDDAVVLMILSFGNFF